MTLTYEQARTIVEDRISYRPNATLRLRPPPGHPYGSTGFGAPLSLIVEMEVQNTYDPGHRPILIAHNRPLTPSALESVEHLIHEIRDALHRVEMHEADEWLKVDGLIVFDPHRDRDHRRAVLEEVGR